MWFLAPIGLGLFFLWAAGLTRSHRGEVERVAGAISRSSLGAAAKALSGPGEQGAVCAVRGQLVADEEPLDPIAGTPVAHYRIWVGRGDRDALKSAPQTVVDETGGTDLCVEDDSGRVVVAVADADLRLGELDRHLETPDLPAEVERFLASRDIALPRARRGEAPPFRLVVDHRSLPAGTELTLVGHAEADEAMVATEGYRGPPRRLPRFVEREGLLPIVTTAPFEALRANEAADRRSFYLLLRGQTTVGVILIAAGAVLGLGWLGLF